MKEELTENQAGGARFFSKQLKKLAQEIDPENPDPMTFQLIIFNAEKVLEILGRIEQENESDSTKKEFDPEVNDFFEKLKFVVFPATQKNSQEDYETNPTIYSSLIFINDALKNIDSETVRKDFKLSLMKFTNEFYKYFMLLGKNKLFEDKWITEINEAEQFILNDKLFEGKMGNSFREFYEKELPGFIEINRPIRDNWLKKFKSL